MTCSDRRRGKHFVESTEDMQLQENEGVDSTFSFTKFQNSLQV